MDSPVLSEEARRSRLKSQMARRKGEVALQQDIETQEDWDEMLSKQGLTVVDVYQEWAGPCISMVSNFKRVKNQAADDLLNFVTAKAERLEPLEKYRGKSEPCFLFVASGTLVNVIRGAKSPLLMKTIIQELEQEHKVLNGECERKLFVDKVIELEEEESEVEEENLLHFNGELVNFADQLEISSREYPKEVTVAIIKPDAVQEGKVDEILQQMTADGIEIIAQEERQLTEEEVRDFYSHLSEESFFEEYVEFMTSGNCCLLVLSKGETGKGIIDEWKKKLGPADVETAKEVDPNSWRALYGSMGFMNALHGSDGPDAAIRELAFFFANLDVPTYQKRTERLERTFALIRPDAYQEYKDEIIEKIKEAGFVIALQKEIQLTLEEAEEFYKEHKDEHYFEELTQAMCSGPLLVLGLAREDAIAKWREMLGPTDIKEAKEIDPDCLRAQYTVPGYQVNMLHGAQTTEDAEAEIERFFPVEQTIAAIKPDAFGTKEEIINKIHESGFRIAAKKETMLTPEIIQKLYGNLQEKEYYDDLVNYMVSGSTMLMVLSREDAVEGWRSLMGPVNPEEAKEENPEYLRALYGKDILQNAVHGMSKGENAEEMISYLFTEEELKAAEEEEARAAQEAAEKPKVKKKKKLSKSEAAAPAPPAAPTETAAAPAPPAPAEAAPPADTAAPAEAAPPADTAAPPADTAAPAEAAPPADTAAPAEAAPPADTAAPAEAAPPADTAAEAAPPADTAAPAEAAPPADTAAPAEAAPPADTAAPTEAAPPAAPAEAAPPADTAAPAEAAPLADTAAEAAPLADTAAEAAPPADTAAPAEAPADTDATAETATPADTVAPTDTAAPADTTSTPVEITETAAAAPDESAVSADPVPIVEFPESPEPNAAATSVAPTQNEEETPS